MALPSVQQLQTPLLAVPYNNDEVTLHHELLTRASQPSPHFSYSEINALPLNGQQAVTAISALWLRRSTAFRWLQQPIGRHLMIDVIEQVIERHPKVKNEGISEGCGGFQPSFPSGISSIPSFLRLGSVPSRSWRPKYLCNRGDHVEQYDRRTETRLHAVSGCQGFS